MYPRLFQIGDSNWLILPTYGVLVAIGFLLALWIARRLARREGIEPDRITDMAVWGLLCALLGAKLALVLLELPEMIQNPKEILATLRYAGIFYGGLLTGILFGVFYTRYHSLPFAKVADITAPCIAIAHTFGRLGCFMAGCCFGKPTELPWGIVFHSELAHQQIGTPLGVPLHPVQLYEALANLSIGLFLLWYYGKKRFDGQIAIIYLFFYAAARFAWEFVRDDARGFFGPLSTSQWLAIAVAIGTLIVLVRMLRRVKSEEETPAGE